MQSTHNQLQLHPDLDKSRLKCNWRRAGRGLGYASLVRSFLICISLIYVINPQHLGNQSRRSEIRGDPNKKHQCTAWAPRRDHTLVFYLPVTSPPLHTWAVNPFLFWPRSLIFTTQAKVNVHSLVHHAKVTTYMKNKRWGTGWLCVCTCICKWPLPQNILAVINKPARAAASRLHSTHCFKDRNGMGLDSRGLMSIGKNATWKFVSHSLRSVKKKQEINKNKINVFIYIFF